MKKTLRNSILALVLFIFNSAHAQTWTGLSTGITSTNGIVDAICVWNGNIYVSGQFTMAGSTSVMNIAKWDGTTWSAIPGLGTTSNHVYALCVYNGALYAGGDFTLNYNRIAKFDGTSWSGLTTGLGASNATVKALTVFNGSLFVGGTFTTAGGTPCQYVALWNGSAWSFPTNQINSNVFCFAIHNNELYLGGAIPSYIYKWVIATSSWVAVPNTFPATGAWAQSMASYNGSLYVSGLSMTTGSSANISKLTGSTWSGVGTGFETTHFALSLMPLSGRLYAGGNFTNAGGTGAKYLASWSSISSTWALGIAGNTVNFTVNALDTVPSPATLYAGGVFSSPYSKIMKSTTLIGIEEESLPVESVSIYPNPAHANLYISIDSELNNPEVEIFNMIGGKVFSSTLPTMQKTINIRNYAAGVYFVKITSGTKVLTKKIVIE